MDEIAFRYVAEQNPQGAFLPGVPLRDLTVADVAAAPAWLRPSIAAQPFYQAVEPAKPKRQAAQEQSKDG
jgi:hypothetical protein